MDNGRLKFTATIDDSDFNKKLNSMQNGVDAIDKNFQSNALKNAQLTKEQQRAFEAYSNVLKGAKEGLKNATDPTQIGVYKKQIEQTTESLRKLIETASKQTKLPKEDFRITPYNSSGNSIGQMKESLKGFKERLIDEKDINNSKQLNKNIQQLEGDIKRATNVGKKGFDELGNAIPKATKNAKELSEQAPILQRGFASALKTISNYFGAFAVIQTVISLIKGAFNTIVQFDDKLLDVSKTTGLAGEELKDLGISLRGLSQELKVVSVDKLLEYSKVAGQLGVKGAKDILAFSEALAKLEITSNISGEEGGAQISRLLTLVDGGVKNVKSFGDEVTKLGNNFAATESEILKNSLAIAQNTGDFNLGRQAVLAYGTATKSIGIEAELTGASIGRMLGVLEQIVRSGKGLENLSKITGKSTDEIKSQFKTDPNGALYSFIKGLNEINKSGGSVRGTLDAIGVTAGRDKRVFSSLATEGFDVLTRALNDVADASGAMQAEFETASTKIENSIEGVKVSWENLILSINGSENIIGNAISFWAIQISKLIDYIGRATTSWKELNRVAGVQSYEKGFDFASSFTGTADEATKEIYKIENALRTLIDRQNKLQEELKTSSKFIFSTNYFKGSRREQAVQEDILAVNKLINELKAQKAGYFTTIYGTNTTTDSTVNQKTEEQLALEAEADRKRREAKALKDAETLAKQRASLITQLGKLEQDINNSVYSGRELEMIKISQRYDELISKATELGLKETKINELKAKEVEFTTYRLDTDDLVKNLQEQQRYYEEFESAKSKIGIEQAKETYKDLIDISKSYYDVLSDAQDSIDFDNMTAKERNRYAVLTKLLVDYGTEQSKQERERLVSLYENTITTEEKISRVRLKYSKLFASAQANFEGSELDARTAILEKQFKDELKGLSNEIISQANDYSNVANLVAGATRNQIESQIQSLTNYLKTAEGLTETQRASIQKMIENLTIALPTALGSSGEGATSAIQREFTQIDSEILKLNNSINALREKGGKNVDLFASEIANLEAQLKGLEERKLDLQLDNLIASGKDIEDLGNKFIELSNTIILSDSVLGGFLKSLGNLAGQTGSVINALGGIGKAFNNIKKQGGLGEIFSSGSKDGGFLGGLGSIAGAVSPIASGATALLGIVSSISKKQKEEYKKFKEFQAGIIQGEKDYQELLRQRNFDNAAKGKPLAEGIQAQIDELNKQAPELEKEYADLLSKIQENGEAVANKYRRKRNGFSKTVTIFEDLKNADYDQLEKLFLQGKLEGDTLKWFEALKKSKEELDKLGLTLDDLKLKLDELVTGTNVSQLSNLFADLFASGTNSAVEFGNKLEDVIKNAILSGFKARFIEKEAQALFDDIAGLINKETPISQDDIDKLIADATKKFDYLNGVFASLTSGLNLNFGGGDLGGGAKDGIKRITETQADRLTGILTGVQQDVIASRLILFESRNFLSSSLNELIAIQVNTKRTADNTESMDYKMTQIVNALQNNQQQALGMP